MSSPPKTFGAVTGAFCFRVGLSVSESACEHHISTSSSAMAERPRELDQRFQMGGQFEAIIQGGPKNRTVS